MFTTRIYLVWKDSEWNPMIAKERFPLALRTGLAAVGEHHVRDILPLHFKGNAKYRYDHEPRSPRYVSQKYKRRARHGGEVLDMVWSGKFREECLTRSSFIVRGNVCSVNIRGRVLNLPSRAGSLVDLKREIMFVTPDELKEHEQFFRDYFIAVLEGAQAAGKTATGRARRPAVTPV